MEYGLTTARSVGRVVAAVSERSVRVTGGREKYARCSSAMVLLDRIGWGRAT